MRICACLLAAATLFWAGFASPAVAQPSFQTPRRDCAVSQEPSALVIADFDRDGVVELAVGARGGIHLLRGADCSPIQPIHAGLGEVRALAAGDFDGDTLLDLVARAADPNSPFNEFTLFLLKGAGDGSFVSATPLRQDGAALAARDFDGDGQLDLAAVRRTGLALLRGNGDGSFRAASVVMGAGDLSCLAAGNLDGNEYPDLAVCHGDGSVSLLRGSGGEGFRDPVRFAAREEASQVQGNDGVNAVVLADVNVDGWDDLIVARALRSVVFLNKGDGTLAGGVALSAPQHSPSVVTTGDANGDGWPDILSAGDAFGSTLALFVGLGEGRFAEARLFAVSGGPTAIGLEDVNADGWADLVAATSRAGAVSVFAGVGEGVFGAEQSVLRGSGSVVHAADFDGDGLTDIVTSSLMLQLRKGRRDGTFEAPVALARRSGSGFPAWDLAVADFDQDGRLDLVSGSMVLLNRGNGEFALSRLEAGLEPVYLVAGDWNGDRKPDLAASNGTQLVTLAGVGDGTFGAARVVPGPGRLGFLQTSDFNGDGRADLSATMSASGAVSDGVMVLIGAGDGSFLPRFPLAAAAPVLYHAVGDWNGDSRPDVVMGVRGSNRLAIHFGTAEGAFREGPTLPGIQAMTLALADYDGDGRLDIAAAEAEQNRIVVVSNPGSGIFAPPLAFATGQDPRGLIGADLNGDGKPDLVAAGPEWLTVLLNTTPR
ncbi:MAG: VCBS repeat-containing protein [Bryobacterales bacterium]|nr:VCBS repeat-containing protein [Bryobacterales bacterium]